MIYYDRRWDGENGIGRFSREVAARLTGLAALPIGGNPASSLDCLKLTFFMFFSRALVISPGFSGPLLGLKRFVLTVHDLNHIDVDHNSGFLKRIYYRFVLRRACRRAARVLTVSEFSKARIVEWAGVPADQVVCVGNGVSKVFSDSQKNDVSRSTEGGFIFCVGNRKGHKNEVAVIKALSRLQGHGSLRIIFSGFESSELVELACRLGVQDRVEFSGPLSESELAEKYRTAAMLVFPSLYEGFGLPAVEAMAVGCPVVTSNTTALGEIAAGAAIGIDPSDTDALADAISRVACSEVLRADLQACGFEKCRAFSWDLVADRVKAVVAQMPH